MRVVLDATVFGIVKHWQSARSGIFRVVEQTALGLQRKPDVDLHLSASESWWNYDRTREFLRSSAEFSDRILVPNDAKTRALVSLHRLADRKIEGSRLATAAPRIARRLSSRVVGRFAPLPRSAVHGQDIFHSGYYALPDSTTRVRGLHRFITIYDLIPMLFPEGVTPQIRSMFDRMLSSIHEDVNCLCISEATKRDLCNVVRIDPARVTVAPLAASPEIFFPVADPEALRAAQLPLGLPDGARYFLSVNTLQPLKNTARAIQAFATFVQQERLTDVYFILVGAQGWEFQQILDAAANSNLALDRILVAGYVPDEHLAPLYSGAIGFVYPSLYEGFGLPPLEAMQCGTPVIVGNGSSFPEVVGDGGILIDPVDQDAIAHAMTTLYRDANLRASLANRAQLQARKFSWERYLEIVYSSYRSAMAA